MTLPGNSGKKEQKDEPGYYDEVHGRAEEYQDIRRPGLFKDSSKHPPRLIHEHFFVKPRNMKTVLAFIASVLGFGALFLVLDLLLFNAQGLSFFFNG